MSPAFHAWFCLLALSMSFVGPAPSRAQSIASTPSRPQSSDEETLRKMTEQYGQAITAGDLGAMREFWNPQSSDLAARIRFYQNLFSEMRIEFISPKVTRLEVTGGKAVSHLTADERRLDKKTGAILLTYDPIQGTCRSFEWIKAGDVWKIEREVLVQDELAARLEATTPAAQSPWRGR